MDYLERLLLRALAEPREAVPALFDPFEQVAAWGPDDVLSTESIGRPAMAEDVRESPALGPSTPPTALPVTLAPPAPGPMAAPHAPPRVPTPAQAQDSAADVARTEPRPSTPLAPAAPAAPETAALARADAFMRGLGVRAMVPDVPQAAAPQPDFHFTSPGPMPMVASHGAAPPGPAGAMLLRPDPPHSTLMPAPPRRVAPERTEPASGQAAPGGPGASARPALAPAAARRIVHTTVVVSAPGRGLDDLAYGSAIARFGIGQG